MKTIFAIDPGNLFSAYCIMTEDYQIIRAEKTENLAVLYNLCSLAKDTDVEVVIEMVACYGMPVGKEVFDTCVWIGRFIQRVNDLGAGINIEFVYRQDEKKLICHSMTAGDANIRRALIDRFAKHDLKNGKGTKNDPDFFYGFKADMWAAFAVGVTYLDKLKAS